MNQLTNLEILEVMGSTLDHYYFPGQVLHDHFFHTHSQLPLQNLCFFSDAGTLGHSVIWLEAPTTLTRLTLHKECRFVSKVLPAQITCLQELHASSMTVTQVATAVPWLKRLELHMNYRDNLLSDLSKLASLQSLAMCVTVQGSDVYWNREQLLTKILEVARAVERGVQLSVKSSVSEFLGALNNPCRARTTWGIRD